MLHTAAASARGKFSHFIDHFVTNTVKTTTNRPDGHHHNLLSRSHLGRRLARPSHTPFPRRASVTGRHRRGNCCCRFRFAAARFWFDDSFLYAGAPFLVLVLLGGRAARSLCPGATPDLELGSGRRRLDRLGVIRLLLLLLLFFLLFLFCEINGGFSQSVIGGSVRAVSGSRSRTELYYTDGNKVCLPT